MKKKNRKLLIAVLVGMLMILSLSVTVSAAAPKNKIVTKSGKQYYYNKSGKIVKGKYGYKIGSKYYKISKTGVLKKVSKVEGLAGIRMNSYFGKSKSKALWSAFQWSAKLRYVADNIRIPSGQTKESYFGLYGFQRKRGDCNVQAATFYWMAKALGYKPKFVQGYVPQLTKSGKIKYGAHAWVTIKSGGKNYVYDPNFSGEHNRKHTLKGMKSGYKFKYGAKNTYKYCNSKKKVIKK